MKSEIIKMVNKPSDVGLRRVTKAQLRKLKKEAAAKKKKK